jgi:hydrocephalus-inducing protein
LSKSYLQIRPQGDILINPREIKEFELVFNPKQRLHQFKKEIQYKILENQELKKLLNVHGTSHGIELKLMEDTIGFGIVTVNSKKVKTVQLSNLGDIGAKFEWNTTFCKRYFTITPDKGYLPPNEDTHFTITFHPDVIDSDINFHKVKCDIQGSDPLYINLLGRSVSHPKEAIQDLKFETIVRQEKK